MPKSFTKGASITVKISLLLALQISNVTFASENNSTTSATVLPMASNDKSGDSFDELMQGFNDTSAAQPSSSPQSDTNNSSNDAELDSLLEGFEDSDSTTSNEPATTQAEKKWEITTLLSLSSSYSYQQTAPSAGQADYRGLTRLKLKVQPELRYKFNSDWDSVFSLSSFYDAAYRLKGRNDFNDEVLDENESELEIRELFIRGTISSALDIKLGRQIVVWGKSDSLRVVDVLNPLDFREPGMVDIEDLRLPVTMAKVDYYFSNWNLSGILIPEVRFNKMPPFGSDFYPAGSNKLPTETVPDHGEKPELAFALSGNFSGWDLSFHLADFYNDQAHFVKSNNPTLEHARLQLIGVATNIVSGSWLLKSEVAYIDGLEFANSLDSFSRADAMIGLDYTGIVDMTFSIEAVNRHLLKYNSNLNSAPDDTQENENQVSFRYTASFLRDKLQSTVLATFFGESPDDGGFYRLSFDYEIDDSMSLIFGGITYQSGDSTFLKNIASNDRIFLDYRYSF